MTTTILTSMKAASRRLLEKRLLARSYEGVIKYRWNALPVEQRDGMKNYISDVICTVMRRVLLSEMETAVCKQAQCYFGPVSFNSSMSYAYMSYQRPKEPSLFKQHCPPCMLFFLGFPWAIFLNLPCLKHF
ncbi:hypothetical protein NC652_041070 [Populus alba x Populus x berolinensis]|nr:hypothetical protein NC652_041070 [Populus alba x Populus x berolinensis]